MRLFRLILLEIGYRKLAFALGLVSVVVAVGGLVGAMTVLRSYDRRTEQLVADKQRDVTEQMAQVEDDFRRMALKMGFTTLILHADQDVGEFCALGHATKYMPEEYGERLAKRKVRTVNHALPMLTQRMAWPERGGRLVQLMGVKGEVYIQSAKQRPLLEAVPAGGVVIGKAIEQSLKLKVGDKLAFAGREFTVSGVRPGRMTADDVGLWINLAEAQAILGRPGQINVIQAVECNCVGDRVKMIEAELRPILPDIKVAEFADTAAFRSDSRKRVAEAAEQVAERERASRAALREGRAGLARVLVPVLAVGCAVWVGLLMFTNVRDRGGEIGVLRAIGLRAWQIAAIFLGKALLMGLVGAAGGFAIGVLLPRVWRDGDTAAAPFLPSLTADPRLLGAVMIAGPALVLIASLLPAILAARQDPADMLRDQ